MKRRLVAGFFAVVLAAAGGALLFRYITFADQRAMAGLTPTPVLVVTEPIAEGTVTGKLARSVKLTSLPARAVAPGAVASLAELDGQVTTVDLKPGEQVLGVGDHGVLVIGRQIERPAGLIGEVVRRPHRRRIDGNQ